VTDLSQDGEATMLQQQSSGAAAGRRRRAACPERPRRSSGCPGGPGRGAAAAPVAGGRKGVGARSLRRVTVMVFIVTVVFVVCWTPYHVMSFIAVHHHHRLARFISRLPANATTGQPLCAPACRPSQPVST